MTGLILYFCLALVVSFFCSLMEAVLLTVSHGHIETIIKEGGRSGEILRHMKNRIDRPLAAVLTLNTVANTAGAAGVGAQALKVANELRPGQSNNFWVAVASAVLTLSILFCSEIIPKTLGAVHWKKLAPVTAHSVNFLVKALMPFVLTSEKIGSLITPKGGLKKVSREEMISTAELGMDEGTLMGQETRIIRNILCLGQVRVKDVLTPRSVLVAFPQGQTIKDIVKKHSPIRFSRIPIYGKDLDDITGLVHRYKVLQTFSQGKQDMPIERLSVPIYAVPDVKSIASVLDEFIKRREHLFLVVDEYGGTAGIITLEDAIETLLGVEIVDEFDTVADMRKLALQIWESRKKIQLKDYKPELPKKQKRE